MSLDSIEIVVADVDEFWYGKPSLSFFQHFLQSWYIVDCTMTIKD